MAAFVHDIVGLLHTSMAMFNAWMGRSRGAGGRGYAGRVKGSLVVALIINRR